MARPAEAYGSTAAGYAAGFLPLPLAVVAWLMYDAANSVGTGSMRLFWVLVAAVPGALVLGPLNVRHTLRALGDEHAATTAKASVLYGVVGLILLLFPFGFLVQLGWIGLVADLAIVSVTVPGLARSRVLARLETERQAERARRVG